MLIKKSKAKQSKVKQKAIGKGDRKRQQRKKTGKEREKDEKAWKKYFMDGNCRSFGIGIDGLRRKEYKR